MPCLKIVHFPISNDHYFALKFSLPRTEMDRDHIMALYNHHMNQELEPEIKSEDHEFEDQDTIKKLTGKNIGDHVKPKGLYKQDVFIIYHKGDEKSQMVLEEAHKTVSVLHNYHNLFTAYSYDISKNSRVGLHLAHKKFPLFRLHKNGEPNRYNEQTYLGNKRSVLHFLMDFSTTDLKLEDTFEEDFK